MRSSLLPVFLFLSLSIRSPPAAAESCRDPAGGRFPLPPAPYSHEAVRSTDWDQPETWGGSVPGHGSIVCIPSGLSVRVKRAEAARLRFLRVEGTLQLASGRDSALKVDTLYIHTSGLLRIGFPASPIAAGRLVELVFISWDGAPIDKGWDPLERSRGLISDGRIRAYGRPKTPWVRVGAGRSLAAGGTRIGLASTPVGWQEGDEIVLTGSFFRRTNAETSSRDERRTLEGVAGPEVVITSPLAHDHRAAPGMSLHVANLSRNLRFRSEALSPGYRRGHIMFTDPRVDLHGAAFIGLGRTDKKRPLDDRRIDIGVDPYTLLEPPPAAAVTNRRGRYAVHFHRNGMGPDLDTPPSAVSGSVVDGTPGWGFVNHSSHVSFQGNVAYDFDGAGFVTEAGDELGEFLGNIAIRGNGHDELDGDGNRVYRPVRSVYENPRRPQPLADFAFRGDGFWFQGPAVRAVDNVASGCDGAGMVWFGAGAVDIDDTFVAPGGQVHNRYTSFPRSAIATVYDGFPDLPSFDPRHWDHSLTDEKIVIADLPILELRGLESYGNLLGLQVRFQNSGSLAWYMEGVFDYDRHIVGGPARSRMVQRLEGLKLWNNETGLRFRYASQWDLDSTLITNFLDYTGEPDGGVGREPFVGAELYHTIPSGNIRGLHVEGYEVAVQFELGPKLDDGTRNITNRQNVTVASSALSGPWWNRPCGVPSPTATSQLGRVTLSLPTGFRHRGFFVRYRPVGGEAWSFAEATAAAPGGITTLTLDGLERARDYTYQVMARCIETQTGEQRQVALSRYSSPAVFRP